MPDISINDKPVTWKTSLISFCIGLSLVFAYAPFSQWWLPFIVIPFWFKIIRELPTKQAFKQGYFFSFGWFASGISWVHVAIDEFGGMPLFVSLLLMLVLCLYLAIYPALACYFSAKITKSNRLNLWLLPFFWMIAEYLRSVVLTGFPWLSLGYSQIDGPLASLAPIVGEVGINLVMLLICVSIVEIYHRKANFKAIAMVSICLLSIITSSQLSWIETTNKQIKVALVQGNIEQSLKWQPEQEWPTMLKYLDLSRINYDADILVWPESAIPVLEPTAQDYLEMVDQSSALNNSAIITGIINYNFETKDYYNSLIVLGKNQKDDDDLTGSYSYNHKNRYYKNHLLPIGEFVPFQEWLRPLAPFFNLPMSSFSRGDYVQNNLVAKGFNILPLICFEIAFPAQLAANMTKDTDILLTVSNDAWFGDSHGPHQHLEIARMRALEFGRPLLRSTNNGITAVINHKGDIVDIIPQFEEVVLKTNIEIVSGNTPYSYIAKLFF